MVLEEEDQQKAGKNLEKYVYDRTEQANTPLALLWRPTTRVNPARAIFVNNDNACFQIYANSPTFCYFTHNSLWNIVKPFFALKGRSSNSL